MDFLIPMSHRRGVFALIARFESAVSVRVVYNNPVVVILETGADAPC